MIQARKEDTDVLVIGGGPAGSTTASILKRYNPNLQVTIVERKEFPRYHIGESLVLEVPRILKDMDVLEEVEAAQFLKKGGATYVWGKDRNPWAFYFNETTGKRPHFEDIKNYAWHVDRAEFDTILLNRARRHGVKVIQPATVTRLLYSGERMTGAVVNDENNDTVEISARFVVDASGRKGVIASRHGTRVLDPLIRNIAMWGYWKGATLEEDYSVSWELSNITIVSTRLGWIWFIPVKEDLVSVGVVTSTDTFRDLAKEDPERFYHSVLNETPELARWLKDAEFSHCPGAPRQLMIERDFNYLHSELTGPGWALVGDSAGFTDPLFTFGVFLAMTSAQLLAYSIGTVLDEGIQRATEEAILPTYEQHVRSYYEAFRAMIAIFYGFNSSKEDYWNHTREILRGQALPEGIDNRDAFLAFTCGYGVNSMLMNEATQHFGNVSLNRIRDMCLKDSMQLQLNQAGDYGDNPASDESCPAWVSKPRFTPTTLPLPGTGRVTPIIRAEFGDATSDDTQVQFPRYLFIPREMMPILNQFDGATSIRQFKRQIADTRFSTPLSSVNQEQFFNHIIKSLSTMGVITHAPPGP